MPHPQQIRVRLFDGHHCGVISSLHLSYHRLFSLGYLCFGPKRLNYQHRPEAKFSVTYTINPICTRHLATQDSVDLCKSSSKVVLFRVWQPYLNLFVLICKCVKPVFLINFLHQCNLSVFLFCFTEISVSFSSVTAFQLPQLTSIGFCTCTVAEQSVSLCLLILSYFLTCDFRYSKTQ